LLKLYAWRAPQVPQKIAVAEILAPQCEQNLAGAASVAGGAVSTGAGVGIVAGCVGIGAAVGIVAGWTGGAVVTVACALIKSISIPPILVATRLFRKAPIAPPIKPHMAPATGNMMIA